MQRYTTHLFEELADTTWARIRDSYLLNCSQGEETITDINLLAIMREGLPNVKVVKFDKDEEALFGLDWEWWIGSEVRGWWRYAVQAKKVDKDGKYKSLNHKVKGRNRYQIDLLEDYSLMYGCVPLYCLYNYNEHSNNSLFWNCTLNFDEPQLGCTLASIDTIRKAINTRGEKYFDNVHRSKDVKPWRCIVKCPGIIQATSGINHPLAGKSYSHVTPFPELPKAFTSLIENANQQNGVETLFTVRIRELTDSDYYYQGDEIISFDERDRPTYRLPRRIIIINLDFG